MTDAYDTPLTAADVAVGDTGPTLVIDDVDRVDFARYAGASGDFNRLHVDEPYAKEAGNPSVFGHGMLTAGFATHFVTDWLGLENVTRFRTRFTDRVWPGDTLEVEGEVTEKYDEGDETFVEIEFAVTNERGDPVVTGDATASLPPSVD